MCSGSTNSSGSYSGAPYFVQTLKNLTVTEGDPVRFDANINANPHPKVRATLADTCEFMFHFNLEFDLCAKFIQLTMFIEMFLIAFVFVRIFAIDYIHLLLLSWDSNLETTEIHCEKTRY